MPQRLVLAVLPLALLVACATGTSDGTGDDGGAATGDDDSGSSTPQPFDSGGGPATVGGDDSGSSSGGSGSSSGSDAGSGSSSGSSSGGPVSCQGLSDCSSLSSKPGVTGVACSNSTCVITCDKDVYDVNGDPSDGCEVADVCGASQGTQKCGIGTDPVDNHEDSNAPNLGTFGCTDSSSAQNITGVVPSDDRPHNPLTGGFDTPTGSAPDYYKITTDAAVVGCVNDANFELQLDAPAKQKACYELHLLTANNNGGQSCTTDLTGHCSITNGSGSYANQDTIHLWVVKAATCTADKFADDANYTITGHL